MAFPTDFSNHYDCVIAGAGLAGACAAAVLSRDRRVLLVDPGGVAAGASGAAAGLVNPFMARRARPTWCMGDALEAIDILVTEAGAESSYHQTGVIRPARSEKQLSYFREAADAYPEMARLADASDLARKHPQLRAPYGALVITCGGWMDVEDFIRALCQLVTHRGGAFAYGWRLAKWEKPNATLTATLKREQEQLRISAERIILCVGQSYPTFDALAKLELRAVKGQTVQVRSPVPLGDLPALSGHGYVVPRTTDTCVIGSTYEHDFTDLQPSAEKNDYLLEKAANMIPSLEEANVLQMKAGARVFPPGSHLPWLGPLPEETGVWFFGALGSRGLLTAPLLSLELPRLLDDPTHIPEEVRLQPATTTEAKV